MAVESRRQRVDRINGEIKVGIEVNFEFDSCPPNYELDNRIVDIDLLFDYRPIVAPERRTRRT
jgi:hypothetical protein